MRFLSSAQCRAARGLLNWTQPDLAKHSGVHVQTISSFENETGTPTKTTLEKITNTFEREGVGFTPDGGVSPYGMRFKHLIGTDGFRLLMDDVYAQAKTVGGEIRIWNGSPKKWIKWLGEDWYKKHVIRMEKLLSKIDVRIATEEGDSLFIGNKFAEYRWVPQDIFNDQAIYCFGSRIAFINFEKNALNIYVLYSQEFTNSFRLLFDFVWDEITIIPEDKDRKPNKKNSGKKK